VCFVDYGTESTVKKEELRFLHKSFAEFPTQAIRASLTNLKPAKSASKWSQAANLRFFQLVSDKCLFAIVSSADHLTSQLEVALVDTTGDEDIHINDILKREGYAEYKFDTTQSRKPLRKPRMLEVPVVDLTEEDDTINDTFIQEKISESKTNIKITPPSTQPQQKIESKNLPSSARQPPPGFMQPVPEMPTCNELPSVPPTMNPLLLNPAYNELPTVPPTMNPLLLNPAYNELPSVPPMMNPLLLNPTISEQFNMQAFLTSLMFPLLYSNTAILMAIQQMMSSLSSPIQPSQATETHKTSRSVSPTDSNLLGEFEVVSPNINNVAEAEQRNTEPILEEETNRNNDEDNDDDDEDVVLVEQVSEEEKQVLVKKIDNGYRSNDDEEEEDDDDDEKEEDVMMEHMKKVKKQFLVKKVHLAGRLVHIVNLQKVAYICTEEIVRLFTSFAGSHIIIVILDSKGGNISFREISHEESAELLAELERHNIKGLQKSFLTNTIMGKVHLTPLCELPKMLTILKVKNRELFIQLQEQIDRFNSDDSYWTTED
ncbi:hypothetical protein L9F63_009005, partial [Diploptera punctata]